MNTISCRICGTPSHFLFQALVLKSYQARYYQCHHCGFVQTEEPYWLEQAYREPIGEADTWNIERSIYAAVLVQSLLPRLGLNNPVILDYGAGYGMLTRLLRNVGLNAWWYDEYAPNLFAQGYQWQNNAVDLITCFEVFEHLTEPRKELEKLLTISRTLLLSTVLIPTPPPAPESWQYYSLDGGQHIAFYTLDTLQYLARCYNLQLYSNGVNLHVLTDRVLNLEELSTEPGWKALIGRIENAFSTTPLYPLLYHRPPAPAQEHNTPAQKHRQYGIALFHALGDILNATIVARQIKATDPTAHIVWYTASRYRFILENNPDIDELIALEGDPKELDRQIDSLRSSRNWHKFYTPAPYTAYEKLLGGDLTELMLASVDFQLTVPLRSVLVLTEKEVRQARAWWDGLPSNRPRILVETEFHSDQSPWDESYAHTMIEQLAHLQPVFVFTAKNRPPYLDALRERYPDVVWCDLPFRLNAELYNLSDAFIGVASGISCLTNSTWCREDVPHIEVVSGPHWSTRHFQHHTHRRICFDGVKFEQALKWLANVLQGDSRDSSPVDESLLELYTHRVEGKYRWLSPSLLPSHPHQLNDPAIYRRIIETLKQVGPFYLCYGGIGDFLLALSKPLEEAAPITVVTYPNSIVAARAFFDALPQITHVVIIPQPKNWPDNIVAGVALRQATLRCSNCKGRGATPPAAEDEFWKSGLNIETTCGVKLYPEWVKRYSGEKSVHPQIVLAPMGSQAGTFRSKRNIIPPHYWKPLLELLHANGIEPIIIGTPNEAEVYPAEEWCLDRRSYSFDEQFRLLASADLVIAADSWHKTFSAMANVPTIVFEPIVNHDLAFWKDSSHIVFIDPWPNIHLVHRWNDFVTTLQKLWQEQFGVPLIKVASSPRERPHRTNPEHPLTSLHPVFWERNYEQARSVLIRIGDAVGDTLMITAITSALKAQHPHLSITIAGGNAAAVIFQGNPDIDAVIESTSMQALRLEADSNIIVDYSYLLDVLPEYYGSMPMMDLLANIAGIKLPSKQLVYTLSRDEAEWAQEYAQSRWNGLRVVGVHLETHKDPLRTYPHQQLLLELLLNQFPDQHILWLGTKPAPLRSSRLTDCAREQLSLREQIALSNMCDAALVIDSVFFHVLHNLWQKPTLLLAGPTSECLIGNYTAAPLHTLRAPECTACYWNQQYCKRLCMRRLPPSRIAQALRVFFDQLATRTLAPQPLPLLPTLQCEWDPLQRHLFTQCMRHRNSGNGVVHLEIVERSYPLPPHADLWNGVTIIRNQNSKISHHIVQPLKELFV